MLKHYQIQKVDSVDFNYAVISKDWFRLDDYINEVSSDFKRKSFKGHVLFDCLLSNGNSNRFLVAYFNGNSFDLNTFKQITQIENRLQQTIEEVYSKNISWIENNLVLSEAQKFLLKKKLLKATKTKIVKRKKLQLA